MMKEKTTYPPEKILGIAIYAGQLILENGGETYRTEEIYTIVCESFDTKECGCFVTPTGILASLTDSHGKRVSQVKRIRKRNIHLEKVALVHNLCRKIKGKEIRPSQAHKELRRISHAKSYPLWLTILAGGFAAGGFCFLFQGKIEDAIAAFICGLFIKITQKIFDKIKLTDFFINIMGGFLATLFAHLLKIFGFQINPDAIVMGSIMLLVPGLAITNAIRDTIAGDLVAGTSRTVEAFFVAVAIAVGSGMALKTVSILGEL